MALFVLQKVKGNEKTLNRAAYFSFREMADAEKM
jgi:hypothetical protein